MVSRAIHIPAWGVPSLPIQEGGVSQNSSHTEIFLEILYNSTRDQGLQEQIRAAAQTDLKNIQDLPSSLREQIVSLIGNRVLQEMFSLSRETDDELFFEALLHFAQTQERLNHLQLAASSYAAIQRHATNSTVVQQARQQLDVFRGSGPAALRWEFLGRQLSHQIADPAMPLAMGVALGGFSGSRALLSGIFRASGPAGFFTTGFGANAAAFTLATSVEIPTFTFAVKGLHELMGIRQDWSGETIWEETRRNATNFFPMKFMGAAGYRVVGGLDRVLSPSSLVYRTASRTLPQAFMFGGILSGQGLEAYLGHRDGDAGSILIDSFAFLFHNHVGGRLYRDLSGSVHPLAEIVLNSGRPRPPRPKFRIPNPLEFLESLVPKGYGRQLAALGPHGGKLPLRWHIMMNEDQSSSSSVPPPPRASGSRESSPPNGHSPISDAELCLRLKDAFGESEKLTFRLYNFYRRRPNWVEEATAITEQLQKAVEQFQQGLDSPKHLSVYRKNTGEILNDLSLILRGLGELKQLASTDHQTFAGIHSYRIEKFLQELFRSPNRLINFINDNEASTLAAARAATRDGHKALLEIHEPVPE